MSPTRKIKAAPATNPELAEAAPEDLTQIPEAIVPDPAFEPQTESEFSEPQGTQPPTEPEWVKPADIFINDITKIRFIDAAGNRFALDYGWAQGQFELRQVRE